MVGRDGLMAAVAGGLGGGVLAWKAFYPSLVDDIRTIRRIRKPQELTTRDVTSRRLVIDMFEETSRLHPERVFVVFEDKIYTYSMINSMASRVANIVARWNLSIGDAVAMMIYNSPEFLWTFLGLLKLGLAGAFINYHLQEEPLIHSLTASQTKYLIVGKGPELLDTIKSVSDKLPADFKIFVSGATADSLPDKFTSFDEQMMQSLPVAVCKSTREKVTLRSPVCYIYTSGTTGLPKPAIINQAKAIRQTHGYRAIDFTQQDVTYVVTPLYHSAATCVGVFNTIGEGATIVLRRKFSASHYWEDVRKYKVTVIQYIGELCRYLLRQPKNPLDGVHCVRAAFGNGLRSDIWREFKTRFNIPQIYEFFGATEGTAILLNCCNKVGALGRWSPLIRWMNGKGKGFCIVKFDPITNKPIRGKEGKCVLINPGETGLLLAVMPPNTNKIYLGTKEMDDKKIVRDVLENGDTFFNFGDSVYLDFDYYVYFRDRIGDTFRWKGENVSTTEVAHVMTQLNFIHDVNVYGIPISGSDGKAGMAAVQLEDGHLMTDETLKKLYEHVFKHLPHYARPIFIRVVAEFVTTQTMKHRKLELVEEGFNVDLIKDPLFVINHKSKTYDRLNSSNIGTIVTSRL
ncbi:long-chain fatty acid transport protein 2-like [Saccostrea cucullata]|uniref:long-chain fatty acid transport protein 2-like n=1 Tax=Saccostrea cuccullata TaxID=36930 RepID=UPI002ED1CEB2